MTILSVVKDVCAAVGVTVPTSIFSNITGNRTMQEMLSLSNEMAQRIAYDARDWTRLQKTCVFTGDGVKQAFDLPANYRRMLLTANVWRSTSAMQPMRFVSDPDEWLRRRAQNWTDAWGEWTMIGGQMLIWPVMGTGITARFLYLDKNCVALKAGGFGDAFIDDADAFVLDERVLKLGMITFWKAGKGTPYAEDMGTYQDALGSVAGRDKPSPIIVGNKTVSVNARVAYPWPVPTP